MQGMVRPSTSILVPQNAPRRILNFDGSYDRNLVYRRQSKHADTLWSKRLAALTLYIAQVHLSMLLC